MIDPLRCVWNLRERGILVASRSVRRGYFPWHQEPFPTSLLETPEQILGGYIIDQLEVSITHLVHQI